MPAAGVAARRWPSVLAASALVVVIVGSGGLGVTYAASQSSAPLPATASQRLVWSDEFVGSKGAAPDATAWTPQTGGDGWGNEELECYTTSRANSALDGAGNLIITARHTAGQLCADGARNDYTSARLSTQGLQTFRYGRVSIRAKMPSGQGIWPAFWALGANHDTAAWPYCGEIDIVEVLGDAPGTVYGSLHGPTARGESYNVGGSVDGGSSADAFHVYSVMWSHDEISYAIDGSSFFTATRQAVVARYGAWPFDHPFYLLVNVAVGGRWPGYPDDTTTFPQRMVVDWVRVYQ